MENLGGASSTAPVGLCLGPDHRLARHRRHPWLAVVKGDTRSEDGGLDDSSLLRMN